MQPRGGEPLPLSVDPIAECCDAPAKESADSASAVTSRETHPSLCVSGGPPGKIRSGSSYVGTGDGIDAFCYAMYPLLTAKRVREAKQLFDYYVELGSASTEPHGSTCHSAGSALGFKPTGPAGISATGPGTDHASRCVLREWGLFQFFADLRIRKSIYEVRDLIEAMNQSPAVLRANTDNHLRFLQSTAGAEMDADARQATAVVTAACHRGATAAQGLTFPLFLHLLCSVDDAAEGLSEPPEASVSDEAAGAIGSPPPRRGHAPGKAAQPKRRAMGVQDSDIAAMFRHMDADHDGVLSVADVRASVKELLRHGSASDDLKQLSRMSALELRVAMHEIDLDGDGAVTLRDLDRVLRTM